MQMPTTWELLYPNPKPKPVEYTPSIVSYLDILGFRELVASSTMILGGPPCADSLAARHREEQLQPELEFLIKEDRSTFYLDYLKACERELNVPEQEYPIFLAHHRDLIRFGLRECADKPSVFSKYVWLRDYHECSLREQFGVGIPSDLHV
jgi:hypothetical protein